MSEDQLRQELTRFCHLTYEKGYVASTDGNLSCRLSDGHILCTPTLSNKGFVKPDDLVVVDMQGKKVRGERKASSEIAMHLLVYEMRKDVQSVVHAHPPCATAYAAAGIPLNKALISEVVLALGCIPLAEYGTPGTPELTNQLRPFVESYDALLMANHGVVTYGVNNEEAFNRMDTVEHFAKISIYTKILGKERLLSNQDVEKLWVQRQRYFGLESTADAKPKDQSCPLTGDTPETIALTRGELIDLIERVVTNLNRN